MYILGRLCIIDLIYILCRINFESFLRLLNFFNIYFVEICFSFAVLCLTTGFFWLYSCLSISDTNFYRRFIVSISGIVGFI